jgi:hypothetical protein
MSKCYLCLGNKRCLIEASIVGQLLIYLSILGITQALQTLHEALDYADHRGRIWKRNFVFERTRSKTRSSDFEQNAPKM